MTFMPRIRHDNLIVQPLPPDETLIYDLDRHRAHSLNRTASLVWEQCDGETTWTQAIDTLRKAGIPADDDLIALTLGRLQKAHLLEEASASSQNVLSRREFMQRSAVAGLAVFLPVVSSINAPEPWQASSGDSDGSLCRHSLAFCDPNIPQQCCPGCLCRPGGGTTWICMGRC